MKKIIVGLVALSSISAFADYSLSKIGKKVVCNGADNLEVTLNAKRTLLTIAKEGASNGPKKIIEIHDNKRSEVSYASNEGALTLSKSGDTFIYDGDSEEDAFTVNCK